MQSMSYLLTGRVELLWVYPSTPYQPLLVLVTWYWSMGLTQAGPAEEVASTTVNTMGHISLYPEYL